MKNVLYFNHLKIILLYIQIGGIWRDILKYMIEAINNRKKSSSTSLTVFIMTVYILGLSIYAKKSKLSTNVLNESEPFAHL